MFAGIFKRGAEESCLFDDRNKFINQDAPHVRQVHPEGKSVKEEGKKKPEKRNKQSKRKQGSNEAAGGQRKTEAVAVVDDDHHGAEGQQKTARKTSKKPKVVGGGTERQTAQQHPQKGKEKSKKDDHGEGGKGSLKRLKKKSRKFDMVESDDGEVAQGRPKKAKNSAKNAAVIPSGDVEEICTLPKRVKKKSRKLETGEDGDGEGVQGQPKKQVKKKLKMVEPKEGASGADRDAGGPNEADQNLDSEKADTSKKQEKSIHKKRLTKKEIRDREEVEAEKLCRTIFVGNLEYKPKLAKKLKQIFTQFGVVESVRLRSGGVAKGSKFPKKFAYCQDAIGKQGTCNAYVVFQEKDSVKPALEFNMQKLPQFGDRHIRVDRATPPAHKAGNSSGRLFGPDRSVFIHNLAPAVTDDDVIQLFDPKGKGIVEAVRLIRDHRFREGKGIGYVKLKSQAEKNRVAKQLANTKFMGKILKVEPVKTHA